jgi:hypothetical protein
MPEEPGNAQDDWVSRYRQRRANRRELRADRRARRRARMGGSPDDAARQGEASNMQGGYFTTKTRPKP